MSELAFDQAFSFRWYDEDGRLHVDRSNLTRVQVAPYRGAEIPGWRELKLDPEKVYYGYRPEDELGKEETIKSVVGIPIQLDHHLDLPSAPATETRVGSTGDNAKFDGTYLSNSIHIQNEDACRRIKDGSMKQLSLAYYYDPDFNSSGEYNGQKFDFTMRNIRGQHLALVEEGRAGKSCCVADHAFQPKEKVMEIENKPDMGKDGTPAVEHAEVRIADAMGGLAELLRSLHKTAPTGEVVDVTEDEADGKIEEIAAAFAKLGASEEDLAKLKEALKELAAKPEPKEPEPAADEGEPEEPKEPAEKVELDDFARDALKACGFDGEDPEFQKAFAEGLKFGEQKAKQEEKPVQPAADECDEEDCATAQDAAIKRFEAKMDAIEDCASVIGKVRASAFDSAGSVYLHALKQLGLNVKNIKPSQAQAMFYGYTAGMKKTSAREGVAQDAAPAESQLFKGINVRL